MLPVLKLEEINIMFIPYYKYNRCDEERYYIWTVILNIIEMLKYTISGLIDNAITKYSYYNLYKCS